MKHSLQLSLVLASACLAGAAGCQTKSTTSAGGGQAESGAAASDDDAGDAGAESAAATGKPAKAALVRRDARASAGMATSARGAAPRAGATPARATAGESGAATGARSAIVSKTTSRLTQVAGAMVKAGSGGVESSAKAPITRATSGAETRSGVAPRPPRNAATSDPGPLPVHALSVAEDVPADEGAETGN